MNKNVLRKITYGLYLISTQDAEKPTGCIANTVMQVTHNTLAISLNHESFTNECIKKTKRFAISILDEQVRPAIFGFFGYRTGRDCNKFDDVKSKKIEELSVLDEGSCGYIICNVINEVETETHTVFIAEIVDGDVLENDNPMTYAYYHAVLKGSSPKAAPTYIEKEK